MPAAVRRACAGGWGSEVYAWQEHTRCMLHRRGTGWEGQLQVHACGGDVACRRRPQVSTTCAVDTWAAPR